MTSQSCAPRHAIRALAALAALALTSTVGTARAEGEALAPVPLAPVTAAPAFAPAGPYAQPAPTPYAPLAPVARGEMTAGPTYADLAMPPHTDPALTVGIVDGVIGLGLLGLGLAYTDDGDTMGGFVGAGIGTLAVGIPMVASGAGRVEYARNSEGAYAAGGALVSIAGTIAGFGVGMTIADRVQSADREATYGGGRSPQYFGTLAFSGIIATALAGVGSGLMIYGALERSPEEQARDAEERAERRAIAARSREAGIEATAPRSVPRRTAGQVLVGVGAASALGAVVSGFTVDDSGDFGGFLHLFTTIPLSVNAGICTAIGIPLWVSGASEVPLDEIAEDDTWVPAVSIGAGQVSMSMRF